MNKPLKGFITYSHKDAKQKDELRERLAVMEQQNELVTWDDCRLTPGDEALQENILEKVADSDLLIYLVSAASLASKNCNRELVEALNQKIKVIPILLEHCDWLRHQISRFEVLPHKGKSLSKWDDKSEGWQNVVEGIWKVIEKIKTREGLSSENTQSDQLTEWVFQQGNFILMLDQINKAIEFYSQALELNPRHVGAYNNRGAAFHMQGEHDKAIKDFTKAIDLEPNFSLAYNNRGAAYDGKNENERAIKEYNKAIELYPNSAIAYLNLGEVYGSKGDYRRALKECSKAIKLMPDYAEAYTTRGGVYNMIGECDKAVVDLNKAIRLKPNYPVAYVNRGATYSRKGNYKRAIKNCNKAIKLYSVRNEVYTMEDEVYTIRGEAYAALGEYDKAIADYTNPSCYSSPKSCLMLVAMINKKTFNSKPTAVTAWIDFGKSCSMRLLVTSTRFLWKCCR
ncbi:tetratricopeptide repeat protein [Candidatus Poribacteria bacterium]|nr:tetratricopeptide repeat protein [Candidatus Poribacteria bacterium]MYA56886.1 tetratricopeptide repeat protein [Candidatus Poribacteria bacterium]